MVTSLGNLLNRKSDGEPVIETIWCGLRRLDDIANNHGVTTQSRLAIKLFCRKVLAQGTFVLLTDQSNELSITHTRRQLSTAMLSLLIDKKTNSCTFV